MSGEDEEGEEREGSNSLGRLVVKPLVEERVPRLAGALYLQLLLMMGLHCRHDTKWGRCRAQGFRDSPQLKRLRMRLYSGAKIVADQH